MKNEIKLIAATTGGALAAGAAMKVLKKTDGSMNPIATIGAAGVGVGLILKGKGNTMKYLGAGLLAMGAMGTVANVASKVPALQKYTPTLGDLYEDEDGNIIEMDGLAGDPQLVQDENGQTYMIEGLAGDDLPEDIYPEEIDEELLGIGGDEEMADVV